VDIVSESTDRAFEYFLSSVFYFVVAALALLSLRIILNLYQVLSKIFKKKLNNTSVNQHSIRIKFLSTKAYF